MATYILNANAGFDGIEVSSFKGGSDAVQNFLKTTFPEGHAPLSVTCTKKDTGKVTQYEIAWQPLVIAKKTINSGIMPVSSNFDFGSDGDPAEGYDA